MIEYIILGLIQGIAEWLPVSSEGLITLVKANFFNQGETLSEIIHLTLFLHLGTFLAALIYFRKDVQTILHNIFSWKQADPSQKKLILFLLISTLISGLLGIFLLQLVETRLQDVEHIEKSITLLVGILLLVTGILQLILHSGTRELKDLEKKDSFLMGIAQGFAALPGLSRSGLTVAGLLMLRFDKTVALKLSFLMSLPIVLGGNILLNLNDFHLSWQAMLGLLCSFLSGLATIHFLLKIAEKINFGYFVLLFGFLTILAYFI